MGLEALTKCADGGKTRSEPLLKAWLLSCAEDKTMLLAKIQ